MARSENTHMKNGEGETADIDELEKANEKEDLKITIEIQYELNKRLRAYIVKTYPERQYGRLREVIAEAIKEFLTERGF